MQVGMKNVPMYLKNVHKYVYSATLVPHVASRNTRIAVVMNVYGIVHPCTSAVFVRKCLIFTKCEILSLYNINVLHVQFTHDVSFYFFSFVSIDIEPKFRYSKINIWYHSPFYFLFLKNLNVNVKKISASY